MAQFNMENDNSDSITEGYDWAIFDEDYIEKYVKYICAICGKVLKEAVQLPHLDIPTRACHSCYTANIRQFVKTIVGVLVQLLFFEAEKFVGYKEKKRQIGIH